MLYSNRLVSERRLEQAGKLSEHLLVFSKHWIVCRDPTDPALPRFLYRNGESGEGACTSSAVSRHPRNNGLFVPRNPLTGSHICSTSMAAMRY